MSNLWRIVNPALAPPQVIFESVDEQASLRVFAVGDARARGFTLNKSEDDGKTWAEVEARAPDAASSPVAEKSDADTRRSSSGASSALERGELGGSSGATEHAETRSKKASK